MTEYQIGADQEYQTFAALVAAIDLAEGDVVTGGDEDFDGIWTPNGSGASGNPITISNADIDVGTSIQRCVFLYAQSYITVDTVKMSNGTQHAIFLDAGGVGNIVQNFECEKTGDASSWAGMIIDDNTDFKILNGTINANNLGAYGIRLQAGASGLIKSVTINNPTSIGVDDPTVDMMQYDNVRVLSSGSNGFVFAGNKTLILKHVGTDGSAAGGVVIDSNNGLIVGQQLNVKNCTFDAFVVRDATTVHANSRIVGIEASYNTADGIGVNGAALPIYDFNCHNNGSDGIEIQSGTTQCRFERGESSYNGSTGSETYGDGITAHGTSANGKCYFALFRRNLKAAVAWDSTGNGHETYHCTSWANQTYFTNNADWCSLENPATPHKNKMCIIGNLTGALLCKILSATDVESDYNVYISNLNPLIGAPFMINWVDKTWTEWLSETSGDTHSIYVHKVSDDRWDVYDATSTVIDVLDYCPILDSGLPDKRPDNPIFGLNLSIAGVNDNYQMDKRKIRMRSLPIPGCFQDVDLPSGFSSPSLILG